MTLQLSGITRLLNTKYSLTKLNGLPRLPNLLLKKKKSSFQNTPKGQKPLGEALPLCSDLLVRPCIKSAMLFLLFD